ncbi:MAG: alpha-E domain-containing protein [Planctomyces sp.]|nr:alpha-E domain-containing protein [Planctomyces sp.]
MLSRVAESVYWLSRYIERAENVARCIDVHLSLTLDLGQEWADQWAPLVYTTGGHELFEKLYGAPTRENVLKFLTFDIDNPNSIMSCVMKARQSARTVRESLSLAVWEELNRFYLQMRERKALGDPEQAVYNEVKRASQLLIGVGDTTQSHTEVWHFSRLGRLLERADQTSRILDVKYFLLLPTLTDVGTSLDITQWSALLRSASALGMYRQEHHRIVPVRVVEFLVLDRDFPRSMRFCVSRAENSLHRITGTAADVFSTRAEQELGRVRADLEFTSADEIIRDGMHEFIDDFQTRLNRVGAAISDSFFAAQDDLPAAQSQSQ